MVLNKFSLNGTLREIGLLVVIALLSGTVVLASAHSVMTSSTLTITQTSVTTTTEYLTSTEYAGQPTQSQSTTSKLDSSFVSIGQSSTSNPSEYILVGGQNGSWFTDSQYPRLYQISLRAHVSRKLDPVDGMGTVWGGGFSGSEWLISGWGSDEGAEKSPDPYLYVFNGVNSIDDTIEDTAESEWNGGDIFAASSNGTSWFVSGMGSGILGSYASYPTNHLSAGLFNGSVFVDLSAELPMQMDGILYANAFNGTDWLVGGGYERSGVIFLFDGHSFIDLTLDAYSAIPSFQSVQSIAWNGKYWLIGGVGFLAEYNGSTFNNLTAQLNDALAFQSGKLSGMNAVNSIAWNGTSWLLGGGLPIAYDNGPSSAWLVTFNPESSIFTDLTPKLPEYAVQPAMSSSILSIAVIPTDGSWIIGGYADNQSILLHLDGGVSDLTRLASGMNYIDWVGV